MKYAPCLEAEERRRRGRRRVLSEDDVKYMGELVDSNPFLTNNDLRTKLLEDRNVRVSEWTVGRTLKEMKFQYRVRYSTSTYLLALIHAHHNTFLFLFLSAASCCDFFHNAGCSTHT